VGETQQLKKQVETKRTSFTKNSLKKQTGKARGRKRTDVDEGDCRRDGNRKEKEKRG